MSHGEIAEFRRMFKLIDSNNSGTIETAELGDFLTLLGEHVEDGQAELLLAELDSDGSGQIDFEEFVAWMSVRQECEAMSVEETAKAMFDIFDTEGTGVITALNFQEVLTKFGEHLQIDEISLIMSEFDNDGTGEIELEEFEEVVRKHLEER